MVTLRRSRTKAAPRRGPRLTPLRLGLIMVAVALLAGLALFNKDRISTALRSGETFDVNFAKDNQLQPFLSQVKVSFVPVGVVSAVEPNEDGTARVSVKVDDGIRAKLGTAPTAVIRPTTLLGGNYFVDLEPGGAPGEFTGDIPVSRTTLPVELDKVASALQPSALAGAQHDVSNVDETLANGGQQAIDRLLADAPGALRPAAGVLDAALGTDETDLTRVVSGMDSASRQLIGKQGQLDAIVGDLSRTSSVLGNRSDELATAIARMPSTLDSTDAGLDRLRTTLGKLRDTAEPARPVVGQLSVTLDHLDPVLVKARPVVHQLNGLLTDARPLVGELVPTVRQAGSLLDDVRGPVLDRINGPVRNFVLSPYHGTGSYAASTTDKPMYQELAYMFATLDRASEMTDHNGPAISFQPGLGAGSVGGLPVNLAQLFAQLANQSGIPVQKGATP